MGLTERARMAYESAAPGSEQLHTAGWAVARALQWVGAADCGQQPAGGAASGEELLVAVDGSYVLTTEHEQQGGCLELEHERRVELDTPLRAAPQDPPLELGSRQTVLARYGPVE
ncbi:MAG: hypothetical protein IT307_10780 [Chloroflexi bacterium]|nr:hypothetical protein [Chloroflexota bacterium]